MEKIQLEYIVLNLSRMFYYLLYNSSFEFITHNRLFSTILYGSILYIITHAIINYCNLDILSILKNYFWIIFTLDIFTFIWELYNLLTTNTLDNNNQNINDSRNNLEVSFNLLKNKINTFLDRNKNNLTITDNNLTHTNYQSRQPTQSKQYNQSIPISPQVNFQTPKIPLSNTKTTGNMSTPISQILKQHIDNTTSDSNIPDNQNISSTPITLLRDKINIPEVKINEDTNESIAGSDIGSIMDLDDFEKSL